MQIVKTYQRELKSSRRFVFENIMDLEHVCVLHKRWFSNLRVLVWRKDYVEYRLTSMFYGLRQEIFVHGAIIDQDHYWYEFVGPVAHIRVDGTINGPDGSLVLTEKISYKFDWYLAPLFELMQPLFGKQKEDILQADTQLLERMYELESEGFRRSDKPVPRIVIYGGNGFFGRLLVADILKYTNAQIVIASRSAKHVDFAHPGRITMFESDVNDRSSVLATINGASVVVCCSGPYQGHSLTLLEACIQKGIHYVDVADDRDFVVRSHQLQDKIEAAGIMAFVGCSVVPGMSSLLTKYSLGEINSVGRTKICITPGTKHPRGPGSFLCLLSTVGKEFNAISESDIRKVRGWTEREVIRFPFPLGQRSVYLIVDIADYFLQPLYFGAKNVEFKIGAELDFLNRAFSILRLLAERFRITNLSPLVPFARPLILLSSLLGTSKGALMVEVTDAHSDSHKLSWSVFRSERGEIIPTVLASVAVQMILNKELHFSGLANLSNWLPFDRFCEELSKRQIKLAKKVGVSKKWEEVDSPHEKNK